MTSRTGDRLPLTYAEICQASAYFRDDWWRAIGAGRVRVRKGESERPFRLEGSEICFMQRSTFVNAMFALSLASPVDTGSISMGRRIAGVAVPDTKAAREATEIARSAEPLEIFNHSLRTYLFAELIANAKKISHDVEIVYIASILHDTGLSRAYMSAEHPFEVDGANVARTLLRKHGVSYSRSDLAWDAVALHDNGGIAQHKQVEVRLVNAGVGADFGAYLDTLAHAAVADVLKAAPRTNFIDVFLSAAATVAKRKPLAAAHSFVADVGYCKVPGFHIPSFCDEVRTDPFAGY